MKYNTTVIQRYLGRISKISKLFPGINFKRKSDTYYYIKGAYYESILNQYKNYNNYLDPHLSTVGLNTIQIETDILPDFLGVNEKDMILKIGKPKYVFNTKNIAIFIYKWRISGINIRCIIHFYNGVVFLVNYNYMPTNENDKNFIMKIFAEKYLNGNIPAITPYNLKIADKNNNIILIDDHFELKFNYLSSRDLEWYAGISKEVNAENVLRDSRIKINEKRLSAII